MYHSVTIGSMNSFSDWHLVPSSRPVIVMPELKTVTVDVPGSNGLLDLSESLTRYPIYSNRSGSLSFHVLNDLEPWNCLYDRMANYLHGKRHTLVLEDDLNYYYEGRFTINWTSNNDGTWSDIEIGYNLDPYKYYYQTSIQEDPELYENIVVNNTLKTLHLENQRTIGKVPIVPEFVVSNISRSGISIQIINTELGINTTKNIVSNGTKKYYDMILSNISGSNTCTVKISGYGTVNIVFRRMAL